LKEMPRRVRLTLRQKIETALVMRRKTKTEMVEATGVARRKIDKCDSEKGTLTCGEITRIAQYLDATVRISIRLPDGPELECSLVSDSDDLIVSARGFGEMIGGECELEFLLEDMQKII